MKISITTAVKLDAKQISSFEKTLSGQLKTANPVFVYVVDPSVLGGIKLTIGSRELDGTLRARLTQVEQQLIAHL